MSKAAPGKAAPAFESAAEEAAADSAGAVERSPGTAQRRRRVPGWWPLPACVVLGALGGAVYATVAEPRYEATSYVLVSPGAHAEAASALGYAQAYGKIATDAVVLRAAEAGAGLPRGALRAKVRAGSSPDAPMVRITGGAPRAGKAADYADAVARSLTSTATKSARRTGVRLTVVSRAAPSAAPVSPSLPIAVSVGASAGGLLGGLALLARPQRRGPADAVPVPAPATGGDDTAAADGGGEPGRQQAQPEGAR
ncbi:hypothetical protein ITI46_14475 [Streptomyces oryzae]|uniref:Lipopolysaccharide biosynthesis protein n=1 Tax=Streptomyces oryzae TaxID=1434886 RepID=A0ABS3XC40_9ACTN|nr:hypothetical protein [Streptomyces oryzae]MBO8192864.1 hypothetical protein [Streptomyces oryzae]